MEQRGQHAGQQKGAVVGAGVGDGAQVQSHSGGLAQCRGGGHAHALAQVRVQFAPQAQAQLGKVAAQYPCRDHMLSFQKGYGPYGASAQDIALEIAGDQDKGVNFAGAQQSFALVRTGHHAGDAHTGGGVDPAGHLAGQGAVVLIAQGHGHLVQRARVEQSPQHAHASHGGQDQEPPENQAPGPGAELPRRRFQNARHVMPPVYCP